MRDEHNETHASMIGRARAAEEAFDGALQHAPTHTRTALVWVRDTVTQCRRMLQAEELEITTESVVELVRLVSQRELAEYSRDEWERAREDDE